MKKVSLILSMLVLVTGALMAQSHSGGGTGKVSMQDFHFKPIEGKNTVRVPDGNGTLTFVKRGDRFSDVVYTDAAGKATRLAPVQPGTGGAPKPACKFPIPDACFGIPNNQSIGMCICKPTDISNGDEQYNIGLLLPAVQKVREAAAKTN